MILAPHLTVQSVCACVWLPLSHQNCKVPESRCLLCAPRFLSCGLGPGTEKLGPVPLSPWHRRQRLQLHPTGDSADYISFPRWPPRSTAVWHHKASTVFRHRLPARQETPVKGTSSTNHTIKPASLLHSHTPYTSTNQITKNIILRPTSHKMCFLNARWQLWQSRPSWQVENGPVHPEGQGVAERAPGRVSWPGSESGPATQEHGLQKMHQTFLSSNVLTGCLGNTILFLSWKN